MLSVANTSIMLSVVTLNGLMLFFFFFMLNVVMLSVFILNVNQGEPKTVYRVNYLEEQLNFVHQNLVRN